MTADKFSIVPLEICLDSRLTKMQIKVLIALFSFRSKNTNTVWPKRKTISSICGYGEQTISRITRQLVDLGWLQKEGKGGFSRSCKYSITVPEVETVTDSETVSETGTTTVSEPDTITVSELGTRKEVTNEVTNEHSAPRKRGPVRISTFLHDCKVKGEKPIPKDHSVFTYCEEAGIPDEYLALCWREFKEKSLESGKKYRDWRRAFKNCVRDNWYRLWWMDENNNCHLTSKGRQANQVQSSREVSYGT